MRVLASDRLEIQIALAAITVRKEMKLAPASVDRHDKFLGNADTRQPKLMRTVKRRDTRTIGEKRSACDKDWANGSFSIVERLATAETTRAQRDAAERS